MGTRSEYVPFNIEYISKLDADSPYQLVNPETIPCHKTVDVRIAPIIYVAELATDKYIFMHSAEFKRSLQLCRLSRQLSSVHRIRERRRRGVCAGVLFIRINAGGSAGCGSGLQNVSSSSSFLPEKSRCLACLCNLGVVRGQEQVGIFRCLRFKWRYNKI